MKPIYLVLVLLAFTIRIHAQAPCVIKIGYDDNGYRVHRVLDCTGGRPANPNDTIPLASADTSKANDSIQNQLAGKFEVYPNPSNDIVYIQLDGISLKEQCSYILTDATGKVLGQSNITGAITSLKLASFADGTYFVILKRGLQVNTIKIAKQYGDGDR
jgi:hypothetical protein